MSAVQTPIPLPAVRSQPEPDPCRRHRPHLVTLHLHGGHDTITTGNGNDIILGGTGNDWINAGNGSNLMLGDNGRFTAAPFDDPNSRFSVHEFTICTIETIGFEDADSGNDVLIAGAGRDLLFGGGGDDVIYAGAGDDLVFGDHAMVKCANGQPFDPDISFTWICTDCTTCSDGHGGQGYLVIKTLNNDTNTGNGNDTIFGEGGNDIIFGQVGDDVLYGGDGNDILIGGSNVAGALDGNDRIDGGADNDLIAGDNAAFCYSEQGYFDPRMQALVGTVIYGTTPGVNDGRALVVGENRFDNPRGRIRFEIVLLDHNKDLGKLTNPAARPWGNDYLAGGAGEDVIFGQLGNDVIQGDGTIGVAKVFNADGIEDVAAFARNLAAAQLSLTLMDGSTYAITDFTRFGANRGFSIASVPTELANFGFNMDPSKPLWVVPSFEGLIDGDDYIEGGGGNDVIFGGRGQDDIIGGSSNLYGLDTPFKRPDGSDLIFGGAGTDITRNDIGDAKIDANGVISTTPGGHAHDADVIIGDNGQIFRLVGINGIQRATDDITANGVRSTGGFLNFNYDYHGIATQGYGSDNNSATYDYIVVRAVEFLDYTEGGIDWNPAAANDIGAADEIHGEAGDDVIYGMKGNDVLYGDGQDDDLIGGYGNDWISGGTGDDGVIGDDGRIMTSRNSATYGEPLFGVIPLLASDPSTRIINGNVLNEFIKTPGDIQTATINVAGELKKAVNLTPFSFDPNFDGTTDEFTTINRKTVDDQGLPGAHNADDIIFGGLGNDWLHGGSGDDAISGGEALPEAYTQVYDAEGKLIGVARSDFYRPYNPVDALRYNPEDPNGWHFDRTRRAGEFALYDEYDPRRKITLNWDGTPNTDPEGGLPWFLNFATDEGILRPSVTVPTNGKNFIETGPVYDDGDDRIFGGTGNDWLVGGTGRDTLYGGFGNDLLNVDDDHDTNGGLNDVPDTHPHYEDRAYGGAGRDVLIGNTGGDRLIDWVGEFNSYLVPFAPFGMATVSRTMQPQLHEFLYALSASHGADPTRAADTGSDPLRNGEPEGELGLVLQKDAAWQSQTGAPTDPQAGNIPGGKRDVLRTANFNDGTLNGSSADGFFQDSGIWNVSGGRLEVAPEFLGGDAASVFYVDQALPGYFEIRAVINAAKPTAGSKSNSYLIFDYASPTDFKFAGVNISTDKLVMGRRTEAGWIIDVQTPAQLKPDTDYSLLLAINGTVATLVVDGAMVFTHVFATTTDQYGVTQGLNRGMVGLGAENSAARIDNVAVQILPPQLTIEETESFDDGVADRFTGLTTGSWTITDQRFTGRPAPGESRAFVNFDLRVGASYMVKVGATFSTATLAGIVFDQYAPDDFKFAAISVSTGQVILGHYTARGGFKVDASSARTLVAGQDYALEVTLKNNTVSMALNGAVVLGYAYNASVSDGGFGLFTQDGAASYDKVTVASNDPAYGNGLAGSPPVAGTDNLNTDEDVSLLITTEQLLANDSDPDGGVLTIIAVTQPTIGALVDNLNGTWTYVPAANWSGTDSFTYTISDPDGRTAIGRVEIQVRPVSDIYTYAGTGGAIADNGNTRFTIVVGDVFIVDELELKLSFSHPAPAELRFFVVSPGGTRVELPRTGGVTLAFAGQVSQGTWTLEVTDTKRRNTGTLNSWSLAIRERVPNQVPVAGDDAFATSEDTALVMTTASLLANDTDAEGGPLTILAWTQPANGTLERLASGDFRYTPNAHWHGMDAFTYTLSDGQGGAATATVTLTVTPVNDAPVAGNDSVTTPRNQALLILISDLLANDTDVDDDVLSITGFSQPGNGVLVDNGDGSLSYTPTTGFYGTDSFTYTVSDGQGGTATGTVTISVTRDNAAPVAENDAFTTAEDTALAIGAASLLANDSDPDGDTLAISAWTQPVNGTLTQAANGDLTYAPRANWYGTDSFTYTVNDGYGGTATATVTITVTPVNDAPVAGNDGFSTDQGIPLHLTPAQLLANDNDVDGDALSVTAWTQPGNGSLSWSDADGRWTYTPNAGFHGTDSFSYTVSDGELTANATVTITVRQASGTLVYTQTPNASIADNRSSQYTMQVNDIRTILDLNVTLNISHPALNELSVFLVGPDGTRVQLIGGLSGSNLTNTKLDDDATVLITSGAAPYTGTWRVAGLANFEGRQLQGTWTLEITDNRKKNTGRLVSWTLEATWGSAMTAASFAPAMADVGPAPTLDEISVLAEAAVQRWFSDGTFSDAQLARINAVRFEVVDLPGQMLAFTTWDVIYIDASAAGFGWFIDTTDTAFSVTTEEGALRAASDSAAYGRMDLLTVLGHELGNLLGLEDKPVGSADLMSATLEAGTRLEVAAGAISAASADDIGYMIMARAAAAYASAQAYESVFTSRFASPSMPGLFSRSPFPEHSLSGNWPEIFPAVYTARLTPMAIAPLTGWVVLRLH
jgi:subtilisin-like proprotein convertase family protein/Ca2+-binding RTX toxin-like protein